MKKIIIFILILGILGLSGFIGYKEYNNYKIKKQEELKQKQYEETKANYKVEVKLKEKNTVSYAIETNLKDLIEESNATFDDKKETFYELGKKEVTLTYIDPYGRTGEYTFETEVIDDVPPVLLAAENVTAYKGEKDKVMEGVICADLLTSKVKCEVVGSYNLNKLGKYNLKYRATDDAGNVSESDFVLEVVNRPEKEPQANVTYTQFKDIYNKYKTDKTMIGIDVSKWQGNINFKKVKQAGAEFVIIRLGVYYNNKHGIDTRYEENIRKAKEAGLKVGLYYYSEASTVKEAIECADMVVKNIKYDIDLPIAYDWEDWGRFNSYKLNIIDFNKTAYAFMDRLKEKGYDGMLYGSKRYLTNIWQAKDYKVWVAQYYKEVTYEGKYMMWQLTSTGLIDGINGAVDVNILYLD